MGCGMSRPYCPPSPTTLDSPLSGYIDPVKYEQSIHGTLSAHLAGSQNKNDACERHLKKTRVLSEDVDRETMRKLGREKGFLK